MHDYFTSCLPSPQKGPDVLVPLGKDAPVFTALANDFSTFPKVNSISDRAYPLYWYNADSGGSIFTHKGYIGINSLSGGGTACDLDTGDFTDNPLLTPANLHADLSQATGSSINQLRLAFQIQKMYEKDARGGTRYQEMIKSHFGVSSPDARLQRPEYLGGERIPININPVIQTSGTTTTSPQGTVAGMSVTSDSHGDFIQSFTEHGLIIGLCVARYEHTYQQGLNRLWSKKARTDFYLPVLANIGEQPVRNIEIYAQGKLFDNEVFGYQEAWADYRYKPSIVTGEMRSNHDKTLDSWHFADNYMSQPYLSSEWIDEDKAPVDRALAVQSNVSNQIFVDFFVQNETTRPMPVYSIPGLIDHN